MFRIHRIFDVTTPTNRQLLSQVQAMLRVQFHDVTHGLRFPPTQSALCRNTETGTAPGCSSHSGPIGCKAVPVVNKAEKQLGALRQCQPLQRREIGVVVPINRHGNVEKVDRTLYPREQPVGDFDAHRQIARFFPMP